MPSPGMGAIASLDYTTEERQRLAKKSLEFECPECGGRTARFLREPSQASADENQAVQAEAREIAAQVTMKGESTNNNSQNVEPAPSPPAEPVLLTPLLQQQQPQQQQLQQPQVQTSNSDVMYNYIIAAILVMLAILIYRRLSPHALV